ncbi:ribosome biogenesis protein NOP53-like [Hydractinia symbiolongicarpus]|uniref:ribosome biogenesis protein NOP53-like n=1 Tax=Hydractinia symbiolongicarpus TaxID=13093 RepID=UPI00254E987E|nr:ribosome biogenesis protein NOP53-like [Hydractinia symbiolongicarpus]
MDKMAEQRKQKKGSKKSKKSWRKNTDIADVEEHLKELRRDDRTGGNVTQKNDQSIFYVDKKKNDPIKTGKTKQIEAGDEEEEEEYVPRKQKLMQKLKKEMQKERDAARKRKVQNIWGQEVMEISNDFLEPTVKKPKVKPVTVGVGKSDIGAVSIPEPGASYNPDYDSHQELLEKANAIEVKKTMEREKLNRKVKSVSVKELKKQSKLWLKEMSEGLFQEVDNTSANSDEGEITDVVKSNMSNKLKTLKTRRKAKTVKEEERERLKLKDVKKKLNDINRIKTFKKEIRKVEQLSATRQKKRVEEKMKTRTKRLGRHKYEDQGITVQLSEDLTGSLRELKPTGNLLEDRFKSLQKRNIIEARKPVVPHRRYKKKTYEKRSYRTKTIKEFEPKT